VVMPRDLCTTNAARCESKGVEMGDMDFRSWRRKGAVGGNVKACVCGSVVERKEKIKII